MGSVTRHAAAAARATVHAICSTASGARSGGTASPAPATRVVAALSGGSDSVALAASAARARSRAASCGSSGSRTSITSSGAAADATSDSAQRSPRALGLPIRVERADVSARARDERRSLEDAARTARHEFFERARAALRRRPRRRSATRATTRPKRSCCGCCAAPDRAGSPAMHPRPGPSSGRCSTAGAPTARVISTRAAWLCRGRNERRRRRFRATGCAPSSCRCIEPRFNPSIVDVSPTQAELAREDWQWLTKRPTVSDAPLVDRRRRLARPRLPELRALPAALQRLVVCRALSTVAGSRPIAFRSRRARRCTSCWKMAPGRSTCRVSTWNGSATAGRLKR